MIAEPLLQRQRRRNRFLFTLLGLLAVCVLAGQLMPRPSAVRDAATGEFAADADLAYPALYTALAPLFQAADHFSILSLRQHAAILIFLNLVWFVFRTFVVWGSFAGWRTLLQELLRWIGFLAAVAAWAAAVILAPRPMAAMRLNDPDLLAVDFHSHTRHSWDARKSFSPERNLEWHRRAGFHAAFITDHNSVDGAREAWATNGPGRGIVALRGEEVSLFQSHWVVLGNAGLIENAKYDVGIEGVERFLREVGTSTEVAVIASLPEYWLHHWDRVETLMDWGAHGFEIVNASPIALDFPQDKRRRILDLCRDRERAVTGITDTHGWGSTVYVWSVLSIPGWTAMDAAALEREIVARIRRPGPDAVRVLIRAKAEPQGVGLDLALTPASVIWEACRALPRMQAAVALAWIALLWAALFRQQAGVSRRKTVI